MAEQDVAEGEVECEADVAEASEAVVAVDSEVRHVVGEDLVGEVASGVEVFEEAEEHRAVGDGVSNSDMLNATR